MRRTFELTFNTKRGTFRVGVDIQKSFAERISFKTGYNLQPAKWLKVTVKDPDLEKVTTPDEIDHIIQASELESLWPSGEEDEYGRPIYVRVDKTNLKNMFPSNPEMAVLKTVPVSSVPFSEIEGSHYFLNVRKIKKGKTRVLSPEDEALYNLVYQGLRVRKEVLLVHYNAMNTNKYGIVYAAPGGLRLSNLIGSNYQKQRAEKQPIETKVKGKMYDRLIGETRDVVLGEYKDDYGEKLEELAAAAVSGEKIVAAAKPKPVCLTRLAALDEDSEEEATE